MTKQNVIGKITEGLVEKIPLKYFVGTIAGFGVAATLGFYAAKVLATGSCDDTSGIEMGSYVDLFNNTTAVPDITSDSQTSTGLTDTSVTVDKVLQPEEFNATICLNGNESVEQLGKPGGLELEVSVDSLNRTVDVAEIIEIPPMPSSYDNEMLFRSDSLYLNSTTGNTYEFAVKEFGKNGCAILEITNMDTNKSISEIVQTGYSQKFAFGNETLDLQVNELFDGLDKKFLEISAETYLNE